MPSALRRALAAPPRDWLDLAVATWELARARRWLGRRTGPELLRDGRRPPPARPLPPAAAGAMADRVARAVARAARRVPWRSDCWVQALAGQAWLDRTGVGSDVFIGVRQDRGGFEAHAWLRQGERIVTGGDVRGFSPLVTPDIPLPPAGAPPGPGPGAVPSPGRREASALDIAGPP